MTPKTYQPTGYCPKCGYAMDPGVCPECGSTISAQRLSRIPPRQRRRQRMRRVSLIVYLIALVYGGYRFYEVAPWPGWLPNRLLSLLGNRGLERVDAEILDRIYADKIDGWPLEQLILNSWRFVYHYAPVIPTNQITRFEIEAVGLGVSDPNLSIYHNGGIYPRLSESETYTIHLAYPDGTEQPLTTQPPILWNTDVSLEIPALAPGEYELRIEGGVEINIYSDTTERTYTLPINHHVPLKVLDKPVNALIKLPYSAAAATQLNSIASLEIEYVPPIPPDMTEGILFATIELSADPLIPLAFDLVRNDCLENGWPTRMSDCFTTEPESIMTFYPCDPNDGPATFDVAMEPSVAVALQNGLTRCFGGVIEWKDVPRIPDDPSQRQIWRLPPTRIYRYETADDDE